MSTKLSFRARALDPSKPMPIYYAEELPDLHEYSAINRAVPQMPSGMEKEEESEHHLQRAIIAGLIIPTPEVTCIKSDDFYDKAYPADFKMPRQLIHVQPLSLEQDIPDYDLDSSDEQWLQSESKTDLTPYKFEQMMDRLEKITVCSLDDAKALVKRNEVNQDVFDYWVSKRLKTKHPLILSVKTDSRGNSASNNPYIAFRRRTEKMQTRKNRKNDETSYEKMLKLRRDLSRAVKLLEMVKRREKMKKDELQMSIDIYEKRYQAKDYSGQLLAEFTATTTKTRPAFAPLYSNQYYHHNSSTNLISQNNQWNSSQNYASMHLNHHHLQNKRDFDGMSTSSSRKEKRQYKKRKHKAQREVIKQAEPYEAMFSSDDEDLSTQLGASESEDEGIYPFRRNRNCNYYKPYTESFGSWPWESQENSEICDPRYRYALTSLCHPRPRCIGFARRRVGRGGRILLDRASSSYDDIWSKLDFTIFDNEKPFDNVDQDSQVKDTCIVNQPAISTSIDGSNKSQKSLNEHLINNNNINNNNIVIKSENSKIIDTSDDQMTMTAAIGSRLPSQMSIDKTTTTTTSSSSSSLDALNQKLDDFEQLLDNANASSNIINKNLVCKKSNDINNDGFHLKTIANNLSSSELFNKSNNINNNNNSNINNIKSNVSVLNSFNSDTMNSCISSTNSSITNNASTSQMKSTDLDASLVRLERTLSMSSSGLNNENDQQSDEKKDNRTALETEQDVYKDLMDEIRSEWLHFQPMPPSSLIDDVIFESDLINDTKKFSVELQLLDESSISGSIKNETENTNCIDNTYLTQPMTFNCRNNSLDLHTLYDNMNSDVVNIKTEPVERDFDYNTNTDNTTATDSKHTTASKEDDVHSNSTTTNEDSGKCQNDKLSNILNSIDYLEYLSCNDNNNDKIGCSNFKLISEKSNLQQQLEKELDTLPIDVADANNVNVKTENDIADFNDPVISSSSTSSTSIVAPIAELQSHNYVLQYGSPATAATVVANNNSELCNNITKFANAANTGNVIQQQFVNTGNTIISSPSQQKMQSIVYDNNTIVLATTAPRKQLNGPADRSLNQNKFKQVFMLDLSQDKRKSIGALNDGNLIKKSYSDLTLGPQNILVSSLNSNLSNSNNLNQQSNTQQFSLVHQKPIILGASTSSSGTAFMQSSSGNATNKIIVTPSQLSGNIYMSTHGKLVIPSSTPQSIILDNAKMIATNQATNQATSQPQVQQQQQQQSQQKIQQTPNQQRVKMENKMNMLIESTGEKNIIYAKYNKNKIYQNIIPVQATGANKNSAQSQNQITTKQISSITTTQPQQQSISVISNNKSLQRIQTAPFTQQTQVMRPQIGTSSVNFQNASSTSKIIQQSNNGSNMIGTVKSNDNNSSSSPR